MMSCLIDQWYELVIERYLNCIDQVFAFVFVKFNSNVKFSNKLLNSYNEGPYS